MQCATCRESLSARLDGHVGPDAEERAVDAHLASCHECRQWRGRAEAVQRQMRLRPAEPVPDLTPAIMARAEIPAASSRAPRWSWTMSGGSSAEWARYTLLVVGVTQLLLALPILLLGETSGATVHAARHLASWDLALAVGMVVVAWRPGLARGLLPFALTLGAALLVTGVFDMTVGRVPALTESTHMLQLVGVALIWFVARATPRTRPEGRAVAAA